MASTVGRPGRSWKKLLLWAIGIGVVVFVLIQLVPYGRSSHSNPPATDPFQWTDPQAEAIAKESCYDCHSNETEWWWATNIAPFSWLVQRDVDAGRSRLNFSDWTGQPSGEEIQAIVNEGEMPPLQYTLIHSGAKLTDAEKQALVQGYAAGIAASGGASSVGSSSGSNTQSTPATTAGAGADAVAVINQRCSTCHLADQALAFRAGSVAEAQALIDDMIQRGAQVTPEEQQLMVQYFTQ
jgi:mono/diheme cytochrome c family protein